MKMVFILAIKYFRDPVIPEVKKQRIVFAGWCYKQM